MSKRKEEKFSKDDFIFALHEAADIMENLEFGGDHAKRQEAAYREVARRLERMAKRAEAQKGSQK